MNGPELERRLAALRLYDRQLTKAIDAQVKAWQDAYDQWELSKYRGDHVTCTQAAERVTDLKKKRAETQGRILHYERVQVKQTGKWFTQGKLRPRGTP